MVEWNTETDVKQGVATVEATEATTSVKVACNSLDFPNSYSHAKIQPVPR